MKMEGINCLLNWLNILKKLYIINVCIIKNVVEFYYRLLIIELYI